MPLCTDWVHENRGKIHRISRFCSSGFYRTELDVRYFTINDTFLICFKTVLIASKSSCIPVAIQFCFLSSSQIDETLILRKKNNKNKTKQNQHRRILKAATNILVSRS